MDAETGITIIDMATKEGGFNLKAMESLFYHATISGCHAKGIDPMFTREESPFAWEDVFVEFAQVATDALLPKEVKDNGTKKKTPTKRITSKN